jgi:hypothetical protein
MRPLFQARRIFTLVSSDPCGEIFRKERLDRR